jgi:hypothetical protein
VRALRWIVAGLVALVLALGIVLVLLAVTNPRAGDARGWERLPGMPEPRGEVASTVVEREGRSLLLVAGGFEGLRAATSTAVHLLDAEQGRWRRLPDLPAARHHAAAAASGGDVYVSGGAPSATDRSPQRQLWVLRAGAGQWEPRADMPEGRSAHRMREVGGRLLVVGGRGDAAGILVYDPGADTWSRGPALPRPRHHLGVVVRDGEVWALGGRDNDEQVLDDVHVWRPGEGGWREGPRLPRPVSAAVEAVLGGEIHLVGGEDPDVIGGGTIDSHLVLDRRQGRWREADPPPLAVHGAAGGAAGGRLVVAGGARRQGLLSPLAWTGVTSAFDPGVVR